MTTLSREFKQNAAPYFSGEKPAFATTLLSALIMANGIEALDWDPLTIQMEVKDDFGVDMPRPVYDKLMGLINALLTDQVYKDVEVFDETVNALTGKGVGVERGVPSVEELAWAVTELQMNDPDPVTRDPKGRFSKDICKYARVVLDEEGMDRAPQVLSFAHSRVPEKEGMDDPSFYAGAWASSQSTADEIDQWIDQAAVSLMGQLLEIGAVAVDQTEPDPMEERSEPRMKVEQKVAEAPPKEAAVDVHAQLSRMVTARSARSQR